MNRNVPSRKIRLSQRKIANEGRKYTAQFDGLPVLHELVDGTVVAGTVESWRAGYPVIRLVDGRTARGGVELVAIGATA